MRRAAGLLAGLAGLGLSFAATAGPVVVNADCRVAAGYQQFYVLGRESHAYEHVVEVERLATGGNSDVTSGTMESVVTLTATSDGQLIHYDHWEDGYDPDPLAPAASTEVHLLARGEVLSLASNGSGGGVAAIVPVVPRGTDLRYDGGDRVTSIGGAVGLVHSFWPEDLANRAGAAEIYPRQTADAGFDFVIPVGVDDYDGDSGEFAPFKYLWLQLQAFEDGTQVQLDNGADVVVVELDAGQTYSSDGRIDETLLPTQGIEIRRGTRMVADRPVQAAILAASDDQQLRFFTLLPRSLWRRDYVIPYLGASDPLEGANLYVFNPSSEVITITAFDDLVPTGVVFRVDPGALVGYRSDAGASHLLPTGSAARLTGDGDFWGLVAVDWTESVSDWGFTLLPTAFLTDDVTLSWAPGADDQSDPPGPDKNVSPVYVVPLADDAVVCADLDGDGVSDDIDTDGDGSTEAGDADFDGDGVADSGCYVTSLRGPGAGLRIYDPSDDDNTGTRIVASVPFAAAWGQEPDLGTRNQVEELDLGYSVTPSNQAFIDPLLTVDVTTDQSTVFDAGAIRFDVLVRSWRRPLTTPRVEAVVPLEVAYAAGSSRLILPDLSLLVDDPSDVVEGASRRLTWAIPVDLGADQRVELGFAAELDSADPERRYDAQIAATANEGAVALTASQCAAIHKGSVRLRHTVDRGVAEPGDVLTYTLSFERSREAGSPPQIGPLLVRELLPPGLSYLPGSAFYTLEPDGAGFGTYDPATRSIAYPQFLSAVAPEQAVTGVFTFQARVEDARSELYCAHAEVIDQGAAALSVVASPRSCTELRRPALGAVLLADAAVGAGRVFSYSLVVTSDGAGDADGVTIVAPIPSAVSYVPDSLRIDAGGGPVGVTDAVDGDAGELVAGELVVRAGTRPSSSSLTLAYDVRAPTAVGISISNFARVQADHVAPTLSNLVVSTTTGAAASVSLTDPGGAVAAWYTIEPPVHVLVEDADQDLDSVTVEQLTVTVGDAATGDSETLLLLEMFAAAGAFAGGPLATAAESATPTVDDGVLELRPGSQVRVTYVDPDDPSEVVEALALVAGAGTPSELRLVDAAGAPLVVLARDVAAYVAVDDLDQDVSPGTDQVPVRLDCAATGDSESLPAEEVAAGSFRTSTDVRLVAATGAAVADDGLLEVIAGAEVVASYVDPDDPSDATDATLAVVGVDLLRNDAITSLSPLSTALSAIFRAGAGLDGRGVDGVADVGEGPSSSAPGSADDDDFYVALIAAGESDPEVGVVVDAGRPLVVYQTSDDTGVLRIVRDGAGLRLFF